MIPHRVITEYTCGHKTVQTPVKYLSMNVNLTIKCQDQRIVKLVQELCSAWSHVGKYLFHFKSD